MHRWNLTKKHFSSTNFLILNYNMLLQKEWCLFPFVFNPIATLICLFVHISAVGLPNRLSLISNQWLTILRKWHTTNSTLTYEAGWLDIMSYHRTTLNLIAMSIMSKYFYAILPSKYLQRYFSHDFGII